MEAIKTSLTVGKYKKSGITLKSSRIIPVLMKEIKNTKPERNKNNSGIMVLWKDLV